MAKPKAYYIDFELGCPYYKKGILDSEPKNDAGRNESDLICWFKGPVCKRPYRVEPKEVCKHCPASFHITDGFTDVSDSSLKKYHEFADTVYEVLQDVARAKDLGGINTTTENKESVSFDDMLRSVDDFMEALFGPRGEEADDEPKNEVDEEEKFDMMSKDQATKKIIFCDIDDFTPDDINEIFNAIFGPFDADKTDKNDQTAKADAGKAQLSLVPQKIIYDIARIREYGNKKYPEGGKDNWKSVKKQRYVDAMLRHISAYVSDPEGVDEESGFPHLYHAATNLAFILEMEDEG